MAEKIKERAVIFSASEQAIIISLNEDHKEVIMAKSNTATAGRARQAAWQKIADKLNA